MRGGNEADRVVGVVNDVHEENVETETGAKINTRQRNKARPARNWWSAAACRQPPSRRASSVPCAS